MPFELGMAIMLQRTTSHRVYVLEARTHRLQETLSDLNGVDPLIHRNDARTLLRCLLGAFINPAGSPRLEDLDGVRTDLGLAAQHYKRQNRTATLFEADTFRALTLAAAESAAARGLLRP
jgi:hypothetical protein